MKRKVLIVDDEPDIRELLAITLGRMNLDTESASDVAEARALLQNTKFNLCLTDMRLPDGDGIDLVREIQEFHADIPVAVITAHGSTETALLALKAGAFDFVSKPVDLIKLRSLVNTALKLSREEEPPVKKRKTGTDSSALEIIGESPQILDLKEQIGKVSRSQAPVFIGGESGSGKELVARAIHQQGPRSDQPFIAVNCGAIPAELMESELFGHLKGSFTGAHTDKKGLFQAADGGSLFLDEIADLPLTMQVKLLRAIQEKSIRPVGSQAEIPVDVRILSASHKNLITEVELGKLRQDLFYRINVIELRAPSLRERPDDIPLLTTHILRSLASDNNQEPVSIGEDAINQLMAYPFPGNVRELENILQRACAMTEGGTINYLDLPEQSSVPATMTSPSRVVSGNQNPDASSEPGTAPVQGNGTYSLEKHLEEVEIKAIKKALEDCRWNKTKAAKQLGMSFRSFRYRIKKLGLDDY